MVLAGYLFFDWHTFWIIWTEWEILETRVRQKCTKPGTHTHRERERERHTHTHSEHRFPAPSSEGCRKPVLGVWERERHTHTHTHREREKERDTHTHQRNTRRFFSFNKFIIQFTFKRYTAHAFFASFRGNEGHIQIYHKDHHNSWLHPAWNKLANHTSPLHNYTKSSHQSRVWSLISLFC